MIFFKYLKLYSLVTSSSFFKFWLLIPLIKNISNYPPFNLLTTDVVPNAKLATNQKANKKDWLIFHYYLENSEKTPRHSTKSIKICPVSSKNVRKVHKNSPEKFFLDKKLMANFFFQHFSILRQFPFWQRDSKERSTSKDPELPTMKELESLPQPCPS